MTATTVELSGSAILLYKGKMIFSAKGANALPQVMLWAKLHGYRIK